MKLELLGLKYKVNYNNKSYIIEATTLYTVDEVKWIVLTGKYYLTKDFNLNNDPLLKINEFIFDTKDEAIQALTIYLSIEDKLQHSISQYKEEIINLRYSLNLKSISDEYKYRNKESHFMSLLTLHNKLKAKKVKCISLSNSNSNSMGIQCSVKNIEDMLLLEQTIKEIEFETDYTVVNYLIGDNYKIVNYSWPLYYYIDGGDVFIRQFAFIKKSEY